MRSSSFSAGCYPTGRSPCQLPQHDHLRRELLSLLDVTQWDASHEYTHWVTKAQEGLFLRNAREKQMVKKKKGHSMLFGKKILRIIEISLANDNRSANKTVLSIKR
jgi:hypothetical protein